MKKPKKTTMAQTTQNEDWLALLKSSLELKKANSDVKNTHPKLAVEPSENGSRIGQMRRPGKPSKRQGPSKRPSITSDVMSGKG